MRVWSFTLGAVLAGATVAVSPLAAQDSAAAFKIDAALATRGQRVFNDRGCVGCHAVGQRRAGPDLAGVVVRRDLDWLRRWIKDPDGMLGTDSIAKAMLAEYNNIKMPTLRLTDDEVEALIHYLARETAKLRGGG